MMHKAVRVMVKPKAEKKFKRGYPLLSKEDIEQVSVLKEEGQLIELTTKTGAYLGTNVSLLLIQICIRGNERKLEVGATKGRHLRFIN